MQTLNASQPPATLAVSLTEAELTAFFPGAARRELLGLFPETLLFTGDDADSLARFLAHHRPQVLLSGWKTPPLGGPPPGESSPSDLRYVCHVTGSVRGLVPRRLMEAGLRVSNWGDGAAETVAENVLMLTLAALRRTQFWGRQMHEHGGWRIDFGGARTLFDRHVAIHGFGRIVRALLPLLAPFRTTVVVYSEGVPPEYIRAHGAQPVPTLDALFDCGADVLVELEALTPRSHGSVREEHLRTLEAGTVFVNSGRGAVVDEAALARIALEGRLQIALDVYAVEPLPIASPLRGLPNVTLMPHIGGPTEDRYPAVGRFALDNLHRWRAGEPLEAEIDLELYDAST
jgi:phosphoglycerate dehydrogenase-like enzyme